MKQEFQFAGHCLTLVVLVVELVVICVVFWVVFFFSFFSKKELSF